MWRIVSLTICAVLISCATRVERIDVESQMDLSGQWNDTDSRLVAEEMIQDALSRVWLTNFYTEQEREPVVIVGTIRNLTTEHIAIGTFVTDIERELINSGKVRFV
ncbi:penicillin-binding protein activator LpoB, partial [candidate division WOR-3 bacterium]|nr:penicillin-binding protein activator LpoB [candidate division WOR-3 bacterium]